MTFQCPAEWGAGGADKIPAISVFDQATILENGNISAEFFHQRQIMGDQNTGQIVFLGEAFKEPNHIGLAENIDIGERFITDQEPGIEGQSAGDGDPLTLSAG